MARWGRYIPLHSLIKHFATLPVVQSHQINIHTFIYLTDFFNRSNASKTPSAGTVNELPVDVRDWMSEEGFSVLIRADGQVAER